MVIFKSTDLWIVYDDYEYYSRILICTSEEEAKYSITDEKFANFRLCHYQRLDDYLENKCEFDEDNGYEKQTRIDNGQYANPDDE